MTLDMGAICQQARKLSIIQLKQFSQELRQILLSSGIDKRIVDDALKTAIKSSNNRKEFYDECLNAFSKLTCDSHRCKRGTDAIGRILVEYCFFRAPDKRMIWPEYSPKDLQARKEFVEDIIPRPLMRYFLVSVRGSISELNKFEASSVLFGKENQIHEERKAVVDKLIRDFTGSHDNISTAWEAIYEDSTFKRIALDIVSDIRRKIEQFGHERYLRILENFRQRDPDRKGINVMHRSFSIEDARQIGECLWTAEGYLVNSLD